jgi:predicted nuclease with RNAse H fold
MLVGIDFGAKMAGTTVIAGLEGEDISLYACEKNRDADAFLASTLLDLKPVVACIDAPLSLPGVYRGMEGFDDYFYRRADRALQAMSPMFLGGLTARAMRLADRLQPHGILLVETYPAEHARRLELKPIGYKARATQIPSILDALRPSKAFPFEISPPQIATQISTWHHLDALLALWTAYRINTGMHEEFGDASEGVILV